MRTQKYSPFLCAGVHFKLNPPSRACTRRRLKANYIAGYEDEGGGRWKEGEEIISFYREVADVLNKHFKTM